MAAERRDLNLSVSARWAHDGGHFFRAPYNSSFLEKPLFDPEEPTDPLAWAPADMLSAMRKTVFDGATGRVALLPNGDRDPDGMEVVI
jgi:hypothetical protein